MRQPLVTHCCNGFSARCAKTSIYHLPPFIYATWYRIRWPYSGMSDSVITRVNNENVYKEEFAYTEISECVYVAFFTVFSCPAFLYIAFFVFCIFLTCIFISCNFMSATTVCQIHVLHFQVLYFLRTFKMHQIQFQLQRSPDFIAGFWPFWGNEMEKKDGEGNRRGRGKGERREVKKGKRKGKRDGGKRKGKEEIWKDLDCSRFTWKVVAKTTCVLSCMSAVNS